MESKKTYTKKEVEQILLKYWKDLAQHGDGNLDDLKNWMKNNLM